MTAILFIFSYVLSSLSVGLFAYGLLRWSIPRLYRDSESFIGEEKETIKPLVAPMADYLRHHEERYDFIRKRVQEYDQNILEAGQFWGGLNGYEVLAAQFTFAILAPCVLLLSGAIFVTGVLVFIMCAFVLAIIAYTYPASSLKSKALRRQQLFVKQLPTALDILRVAAEAGLDFHSSANYLVTIYIPGPVKEEMILFKRELMLGASAVVALNNLARRVNLPEVSGVFVSLAQAIEMGTSISGMLGSTARELRRKRVLQAESEAQKASVRITFPLLLLILPGVLIVLFGPVLQNLIKSWGFM